MTTRLTADDTPTILKYEYNAHSNRTWVRVETDQFTEWMYVSGRVPRGDVLPLLRPLLSDMMAYFSQSGPIAHRKALDGLDRSTGCTFQCWTAQQAATYTMSITKTTRTQIRGIDADPSAERETP